MNNVNLGCGKLKKEGWLNIDISKEVNPDKVWDIRKGLPFLEDNSCEEVHAGCVLEQICGNEDFIKVMNEIFRVLKPEGKLTGYVPNANYPCAFQDPMDCRYFNNETWKYFDIKENHYQEFGKHYGFKPFTNITFSTNDSGIMFFQLQPYKNGTEI